MNAIKFVDQNEKSMWSKEIADGRTIYSACVEVNDTVLDLVTLFDRNEKSLVWIKSENADTLVKTQESVIKQINNGVLKPYRAFSEKPFYEGQEEDINPSTEAKLGRYSQVRLCPADKHASLHRQYVVETVSVAEPQPVISAEA